MNEKGSLQMTCGFIYIVSGAKYLEECVQSARSVKKHHNLPITLICDCRPNSNDAWLFDRIHLDLKGFSYSDKIRMRESPYDKTVFLDCDTIVTRSLQEVFDVLEHFDLAIQFGLGGNHYIIEGVPPLFREPSAGIVAWKKSVVVDDFFERWRKSYDEIESAQVAAGSVRPFEGAWDQRSLREASYFSSVRIAPLPIEYQFITYWPNFYNYDVHMVHGRNVSNTLLREIQGREGGKVWLPKIGLVPSLENPSILEVFRFFSRFLSRALRRKFRLLLHALRLWRLPESKRPA